MADEDLTIAGSESAPPTIVAEQQTAEVPETVLAPSAETTEDGEAQPEAAAEYVTVDRNGKTYQVPKELEGEFLMQADYTRKRQADAEVAKALKEREQRIEQQAKATDEELDIRANLRTIDAELARFKDFDWPRYQQARQADPFGADEAWNYAQHLRTQRSEAAASLETRQTERTQKAQQDLAKRVEETLTFAREKIPNFKPEMIGQMVELAQNLGVPEDAIKANWSPTFFALLHRAQIGEQVLKQQSAPKNAVPKTPVAPLVTVKATSGAAPSRSLADIAKSDDMEAYAAARRAGKGGR